MTAFSKTILDVSFAAHSRFKRAAPDQGGLLSGHDPTSFNTADPLRTWIIQIGIILLTTQLLSLLLKNMRQPRVIAEVLGGILLGPTGFGRIPGFSNHIFPHNSLPFLSLAANIGLVLFLFLVGMEIDGKVIKRNARLSLAIALGGIVLPFGLGSAYSTALYKKFVEPSIQFTHFLLFVGVAFSITAFPILCRILTELKLLDTTVGIVVLSAGVANDLVGWILLALSVALVNAGSGLTALWILLVSVGWALFLLFPTRTALLWLARRTGSIENGPTMFFMTAVMLMVFTSAFFTDVIGVHAIFGGFLGGLIIPRNGGLTIALTKKLEDIVYIVFLPLYFTLSGLSTDLGLLNNGITWGYTIGIVTLCILFGLLLLRWTHSHTAYIGKFGGGSIAARISGFSWREAAAVGTLMSCKGLIEIIVLNVGLTAGILNTRLFSMFVLEALLLTCMTTPVVVKLYPPEFRQRCVATGANFTDVEESAAKDGKLVSPVVSDKNGWKTRFTVILDRLEHLPGIMTVTQLFLPSDLELDKSEAPGDSASSSSSAITAPPQSSTTLPIIHALRLIELSDRTSAVMEYSGSDSLISTDPLLNVFRTFSDLNDIPVSASLSVVPFDELATKVAEHSKEKLSQLVLVPWIPHTVPTTHSPGHHSVGERSPQVHSTPHATFLDGYFSFSISEQTSSVVHSEFVRAIFAQSSVDVALFVDRGPAGSGHFSKRHICLPFFGGPDDRLALSLVVQLCGNPGTTATVFRAAKAELIADKTEVPGPVAGSQGGNRSTITSVSGFPDTVYGTVTTQLQSETEDDILWQSYASLSGSSVLSPTIRAALTRVELIELASPTLLRSVLTRIEKDTDRAVERNVRPFVVVGRGHRLASESHDTELKELMEGKSEGLVEVRKTMGDVATAFVVYGNIAGLVVVQAAGKSTDD